MINNNFSVGRTFTPNPGTTHFMGRTRNINTQNIFGGGNNFPGIPGINNSPTSPEFRSRLTNTQNAARSLQTAMANIRSAGSPFNAAMPISGNDDRMRITGFDANRLRNTNIQGMNVEIIQTAAAQRNEGNVFFAEERAVDAGFTTGDNQLTVEIGGRLHTISFEVDDNTTVRDVQNSLANAINEADIGVTAAVNVNQQSGTSFLSIEGDQTGRNNTFAISGNAANVLGMNVEENFTAARDAQFRVNRGNITGPLQTSATNNVNLGHGITAELREAGNARVEAGRDEAGQISSFRNMINAFNSLMDNARSNAQAAGDARPGRDILGSMQGAGRLERDLRSAFMSGSQALGRLGVTMNNQGRLTIDEERLTAAAESGELERFVQGVGAGSGSGSSFMNRVSRTADNVVRRPENYVGGDSGSQNQWEQNFGQGGINFGGVNLNVSQFTRINSMMNMGMLFDSLF